jgi:hypothetical protein
LPFCASSSAVAAPIPRLPPVTRMMPFDAMKFPPLLVRE